MALSRLQSIPIEIQFYASKELGPYDLLSLSHVSTYWRAFVLSDKRWAEWFSMIVDDKDDTLETCLTNFSVLDSFSKRSLVYICLRSKCEVCGISDAPLLFIPHQERVCDKCLETDKFAVLAIAAAAAKYDLRERELYDLTILEWVSPHRNSKRPTRLVSDARAQQVAIKKFGSLDALNTHLATHKKSALSSYAAKSEDYRQAYNTRAALQERGELDKAEAVVLASTGRRIPKAFPSYPGILAPPGAGRRVDRRVACFEPRRMWVLGNEVVVEAPRDGDDDDDE